MYQYIKYLLPNIISSLLILFSCCQVTADQIQLTLTPKSIPEPRMIVLRMYKKDDHQSIVAIIQESAYWLNGDRGALQQLENSENCILVCTINNHVVGFIIYTTYNNEMRLFGTIRYMAVTSTCRYSGLGRILLASALSHLESFHVETVDLSVRADNERAIQFYESFGFRKMLNENGPSEWITMSCIYENFAPFAVLQSLANLAAAATTKLEPQS